MQRTAKDKPELSPKVEKILEDIDMGKVKTKRYNVDEFLDFVDKVVSE
ncbi:hypothetical protein [Candidatus Nitrosotalea okcheonensis]|uniref:Uncharacterized protein n=1 Tax=Candidatus Nitrosotalea okcheonensis TaxID=1903276 RepID=A0A2H1FIE2_9ARCH|nr:hypothetical protein [Candidatus Nitrosotalea okcheonensis]MDE2588806.1 hypothetical protein [Patescibacteria group bacterium]SMH72531.1 protein of unknown function [Candidatus Nitrosotalea okcheonensis]